MSDLGFVLSSANRNKDLYLFDEGEYHAGPTPTDSGTIDYCWIGLERGRVGSILEDR